MDPEWMRSIHWVLSVCPRLCRYARAVRVYMRRPPPSSPTSDAEDVKKINAFLVATMAVLVKMKACGAPQDLIDKALAESVLLVQPQLEAMLLRQQLAVDALKAMRSPEREMPATATAVPTVAPVRDARAAIDEAGEPVAAARAASSPYSGADRRKRC
jgi:hypothetical protein